LVNTTAPEHYEKHIYWRRLQYDDSCVDLKPFVLDQFNDYAQAEFKAWQVGLRRVRVLSYRGSQ
jgi:hypothetical protein